MRVRLHSVFFTVALVLSIVGARGQLITNGSFELGTGQAVGSGLYVIKTPGSTDITGWTIISDQLAWDNGSFPSFGFTAPDGNFFLDLTGDNDSVPHAGVQQSFSTISGETYRVSFVLGTGTGPSTGPISLTLTAGPASQLFTDSSTTTDWTTYFLDFTADATTSTVTFQGTSTPSGGIFIGLDNVSVTAIPEPAECAGLAGFAGLAATIWFRRRSRSRIETARESRE